MIALRWLALAALLVLLAACLYASDWIAAIGPAFCLAIWADIVLTRRKA